MALMRVTRRQICGGIVEIGEGEYVMNDSLHMRSNVTVRGKKDKTVLRKANGVEARLVLAAAAKPAATR